MSLALVLNERIYREEQPTLDEVYFGQLIPCKYVWSDGPHPRVLTEMANVLERLLSVIFDRSYRSRNWRKANIAVIFKKASISTSENYRPISFYLVPGKNQETRPAETQFWGYEGQSACEESVLTKGKSLLRNLFASCAKQTDLWMRLD